MNEDLNKLTPHKDGKRRRMIMKTLTNVALTERGANPEANVTFYKSADGKDISKKNEKNEEKDSDLVKRLILSESEEGHSHLISLNDYNLGAKGGETSWTNGHDHPFVINDDGSFTIGEAAGHMHQYLGNINTIIKSKNEENLTEENAEDGDLNKQESIMGDKTKITVDEAVAKITTLETQLAQAVKLALLNDAHKMHYNTLDEAKKEVFLGKTEEERNAEITAIKSEDPVVYTSLDKMVFVKSDDPRLVTMAKEADASKKALAKAKEETETLTLTKRASEEFSNLPGKVEAQIELLKVVSNIKDETLRDDVEKMLKAHNTGMKSVFKEVGSSEVSKEVDNSTDELERLTKEYQKAHPEVDYYDAYDIVKTANTELYEKAVKGQ